MHKWKRSAPTVVLLSFPASPDWPWVLSVSCWSRGGQRWRLCHGASSRWGVCWVPAAKLVTEMTACFVSLQGPHTDSLQAWRQTNRRSSNARYRDLSLAFSLSVSLSPSYKLSEQRQPACKHVVMFNRTSASFQFSVSNQIMMQSSSITSRII